MKLFDSHCHLENEKFKDDFNDILNNMESAHVERCICAGSDMQTSEKIVSLTEQYPQIYGVVGIHPHESKFFKDEDLSTIAKWLENEKIVGIGEIGLDYFYDLSDRDIQKAVVNKQLDLACELDVPAVFHIRDAHGDFLDILKNRKKNIPKRGVMHCFSGSVETAEQYMKLGFYISFSGTITFKNAAKLPKLAKIIPKEKFLIETDSPYLAPVPFRGKRNEPSNVAQVAIKIAQLRGISPDEVALQAYNNTCELYNI